MWNLFPFLWVSIFNLSYNIGKIFSLLSTYFLGKLSQYSPPTTGQMGTAGRSRLLYRNLSICLLNDPRHCHEMCFQPQGQYPGEWVSDNPWSSGSLVLPTNMDLSVIYVGHFGYSIKSLIPAPGQSLTQLNPTPTTDHWSLAEVDT